MTEWWRYLPERIDPIVFTAGSFSLRWYAVLFLLGWFVSFLFLARILRRDATVPIGRASLPDLALAVFAGAVAGGRLGYAALYDPSLFSAPLSLVSPFDPSGAWVGIWGMSFHGALVGASVGILLFARSKGIDFWRIADFVVPAVPIALFFGRIGNFLNLELYGRATEKSWGMHFPGVSGFRHPSQLYEAFLEGVLLFFVVSFVAGRRVKKGLLSASFLFLYGFMRFLVEFFREPDAGFSPVFGWMSRGQAFSIVMMTVSIILFIFLRSRKDDTLKRKER
jgi:phosphatidylglycerol:prolipoprotein diacylglycerol transferase